MSDRYQEGDTVLVDANAEGLTFRKEEAQVGVGGVNKLSRGAASFDKAQDRCCAPTRER